MLNKLDYGAIFIGFIVDLSTSFLFSFLVADLFGGHLPLVAYLFIGLSFVTLGGIVAAKLSKTYQLYNATSVGLVSLLIGIPFYSSFPIWFSLASIIMTPPFAYYGGIVARKI